MRCRPSTRTLRLVGKLRAESDGQKKGGDCITPALGTPERVSYFFLAFFLAFFVADLAFFLRFATIFASSLFRGSAWLTTRQQERVFYSTVPIFSLSPQRLMPARLQLKRRAPPRLGMNLGGAEQLSVD